MIEHKIYDILNKPTHFEKNLTFSHTLVVINYRHQFFFFES